MPCSIWATGCPPFDIALVQAGEHSGRLDAVFKLLAAYYNDRAALLRQMISDLAYPAFRFSHGHLPLSLHCLFQQQQFDRSFC